MLFGSHGDGSRIGLISANREGLVSCAGYFVIYAGWIQIGKWLLRPRSACFCDTFFLIFIAHQAKLCIKIGGSYKVQKAGLNIYIYIVKYSTVLLSAHGYVSPQKNLVW